MPMPVQTLPAANRPEGQPGRGAGDRIDRDVRTALAKHLPVFLVVDRQTSVRHAVQHGELLGDPQRRLVQRQGVAQHEDGAAR